MLLHNWSKHEMIPLFRALIAKSLCQMESTQTSIGKGNCRVTCHHILFPQANYSCLFLCRNTKSLANVYFLHIFN